MKRIIWIMMMASLAILMCQGCREKIEEPAPTDWYSEIRSANKLVLAQMSIRKMATIDDLPLDEARGLRQKMSALFDAIKVGSRKGAYSYSTYLRAYVDMNELHPEDVSVDEQNKRIELRLPEIRTEFAGRDISISEDHYRVTGLRSQIRPEERAALKEEMNSRLKQEVEEKPAFREHLVATARAKAAEYFRSVGESEGYEVIIK